MARSKRRAFGLHILILIGCGGGCRPEPPTHKPGLPSSDSAEWPIRNEEPRISDLRRWALADPKSAQRRVELARNLAASGNLSEAAEHLDAAARFDSRNFAAQLEAAAARFRLREYALAEQRYGRLVESWPRQGEGWEGLSGSLFFQRRYLESVKAARKAVHLKPEEPRYRAALAAALMEHATQFPSIEASYIEELREARRELQKLTRLWPNKGDLFFRLGRVAMELGDYSRAAKALERARLLLPPRPESALLLARAWMRLGRRKEALKLVDEALDQTPDAALYHFRGQLLTTTTHGNREQALEAFANARRMAPTAATFRAAYGAALMRAGRLAEARNELIAAAELDPFRPFPLQQLATLYTRLGEPEKAKTAAREASFAVRDDQRMRRLEAQAEAEPRNLLVHLTLADRYREMGKNGPARDEYLMVLEIDPGHSHARASLSTLARESAKPRSLP